MFLEAKSLIKTKHSWMSALCSQPLHLLRILLAFLCPGLASASEPAAPQRRLWGRDYRALWAHTHRLLTSRRSNQTRKEWMLLNWLFCTFLWRIFFLPPAIEGKYNIASKIHHEPLGGNFSKTFMKHLEYFYLNIFFLQFLSSNLVWYISASDMF